MSARDGRERMMIELPPAVIARIDEVSRSKGQWRAAKLIEQLLITIVRADLFDSVLER
jgi:hypothetical protein